MKYTFLILLFIFLVNFWETSAQEKSYKNRVVDIKNIPDTVLLNSKYKTGMEVGTSFSSNLKDGYGFETYFSPNLSYFPSNSLRFDFNATLGSVNYTNMTLFNYYNSTRVVSGIGNYFGIAGQGTYKINDKLYLSSGGFTEKLPDWEPMGNKNENRMNYGGSLLFGYKISEKLSIQAGFGVQRYNDPWSLSPFPNSHGFMP